LFLRSGDLFAIDPDLTAVLRLELVEAAQRVDLPDPLGPRMTTTLPLPTEKLTPFKASTPVKDFLKLLTLTIKSWFGIAVHPSFDKFHQE